MCSVMTCPRVLQLKFVTGDLVILHTDRHVRSTFRPRKSMKSWICFCTLEVTSTVQKQIHDFLEGYQPSFLFYIGGVADNLHACFYEGGCFYICGVAVCNGRSFTDV